MAQTMTASRAPVYQNNYPSSSASVNADMHHSWHPPHHSSHIPTNTINPVSSSRPQPVQSSRGARTVSRAGHSKSDFYKNGRPTEVIVIDSESPEPAAQSSTKRKRENSISTSTTVSAATKRARKSQNDETLLLSNKGQYSAAHKPHSVLWFKDDRGVYRARDVIVPKVDEGENVSTAKVDDSEGHYIVVEDAMLTNRYKITRLLGQGTFGKVVQCYDREEQRYCAVKIIRAVQKYRDASKIELRVLSTLSRNDPHNSKKCIHLQDCFDYRNHICIVTELLGMSVFDFLKGNYFIPFPPSHIQHFAKQLLESVAFLHSLNLVHTDLKPENILLVDNDSFEVKSNARGQRSKKILKNSEIRLIDFGSATFNDEYHSNLVSTRHYRAPEIILGCGWSFPCDLWSIGCILVEFCTGDALFQTHDNLEHMAMMEPICGKINAKMMRAANKASQQKLFKDGRLDYPNSETTKQSRKYVKAMKPLKEMIRPDTELNRELLDLLQKIFVYDPVRRITAVQALRHRYFRIPATEDFKRQAIVP